MEETGSSLGIAPHPHSVLLHFRSLLLMVVTMIQTTKVLGAVSPSVLGHQDCLCGLWGQAVPCRGTRNVTCPVQSGCAFAYTLFSSSQPRSEKRSLSPALQASLSQPVLSPQHRSFTPYNSLQLCPIQSLCSKCLFYICLFVCLFSASAQRLPPGNLLCIPHLDASCLSWRLKARVTLPMCLHPRAWTPLPLLPTFCSPQLCGGFLPGGQRWHFAQMLVLGRTENLK